MSLSYTSMNMIFENNFEIDNVNDSLIDEYYYQCFLDEYYEDYDDY